jgi:hypothetical protein
MLLSGRLKGRGSKFLVRCFNRKIMGRRPRNATSGCANITNSLETVTAMYLYFQ